MASLDDERQRELVAELVAMSVSERKSRVDDLDELLSADSLYVQSRAMEAVVELSEYYPAAVIPLIDTLVTQLGDDALGEDAALIIGNVAAEDPSVVSQRLPVLIALIDTGGAVTVNVTYALAALSESSASSLTQKGILTQLFALIDDDNSAVRTNVTGILAAIAEAEPSAIVDSFDLIQARLSDSTPAVRQNTAMAVGHLGKTAPETVFAALEPLCALLDSDDPEIRAQVRFALGAVIDGAAAVDADSLKPLVDRLEAETPLVRQQASYVLAEMARTNPAAVSSLAEQLTRRFADSEPAVRRNAIRAISEVESEFPDQVDDARDVLQSALSGCGTDGDAPSFEPQELRGLASEEYAPSTLRRSARETLVRVGSDEARTAS